MVFSTKYATGTWRVRSKPVVAFVKEPGMLECHWQGSTINIPFDKELDRKEEVELDETALEPVLIDGWKKARKDARKTLKK